MQHVSYHLAKSRKHILKAMKEISRKSCIRFVEHTDEKNWVKFVDEGAYVFGVLFTVFKVHFMLYFSEACKTLTNIYFFLFLFGNATKQEANLKFDSVGCIIMLLLF